MWPQISANISSCVASLLQWTFYISYSIFMRLLTCSLFSIRLISFRVLSSWERNRNVMRLYQMVWVRHRLFSSQIGISVSNGLSVCSLFMLFSTSRTSHPNFPEPTSGSSILDLDINILTSPKAIQNGPTQRPHGGGRNHLTFWCFLRQLIHHLRYKVCR